MLANGAISALCAASLVVVFLAYYLSGPWLFCSLVLMAVLLYFASAIVHCLRYSFGAIARACWWCVFAPWRGLFVPPFCSGSTGSRTAYPPVRSVLCQYEPADNGEVEERDHESDDDGEGSDREAPRRRRRFVHEARKKVISAAPDPDELYPRCQFTRNDYPCCEAGSVVECYQRRWFERYSVKPWQLHRPEFVVVFGDLVVPHAIDVRVAHHRGGDIAVRNAQVHAVDVYIWQKRRAKCVWCGFLFILMGLLSFFLRSWSAQILLAGVMYWAISGFLVGMLCGGSYMKSESWVSAQMLWSLASVYHCADGQGMLPMRERASQLCGFNFPAALSAPVIDTTSLLCYKLICHRCAWNPEGFQVSTAS